MSCKRSAVPPAIAFAPDLMKNDDFISAAPVTRATAPGGWQLEKEQRPDTSNYEHFITSNH